MVVERVGEGGLDVGVHAALAPLGQRGPLQLGQVVYQLVPEGQPHRVPYRQLRQLFHRRRGLVLRLVEFGYGRFFMLVRPFDSNAIFAHIALRLLLLLRDRGDRRRLLVGDELVSVAFLCERRPAAAVAICRQVLRRRERGRRRRWRRAALMMRLRRLLIRNLAFGGL